LDALILVDVGGRLTLGKLTKADGTVAAQGDVTNAKVKLFEPGDQNDTSDPLQDWADATVASDGTVYYDLDAALADDAGENYRALWRYTLDSRTQYRDQIFHIVQTRFDKTYTADDLDSEEPWLATFTHITEAHKSQVIDAAYDDVWAKLKGTGRMPWLVFNQSDINRVVHYRAMEKLCLGQMRETGDAWHTKAAAYHEMYESLWGQIAISYSEDDDATPDETLSWNEVRTVRV